MIDCLYRMLNLVGQVQCGNAVTKSLTSDYTYPQPTVNCPNSPDCTFGYKERFCRETAKQHIEVFHEAAEDVLDEWWCDGGDSTSRCRYCKTPNYAPDDDKHKDYCLIKRLQAAMKECKETTDDR